MTEIEMQTHDRRVEAAQAACGGIAIAALLGALMTSGPWAGVCFIACGLGASGFVALCFGYYLPISER